MQVATLELCKELFELSGWGKGDYEQTDWFFRYGKHLTGEKEVWGIAPDASMGEFPAYELGYLLRKLPPYISKTEPGEAPSSDPDEDDKVDHVLRLEPYGEDWCASYIYDEGDVCSHLEVGNTPEDAAAKLAIELFKQGVLSK